MAQWNVSFTQWSLVHQELKAKYYAKCVPYEIRDNYVKIFIFSHLSSSLCGQFCAQVNFCVHKCVFCDAFTKGDQVRS
jgi:hypothetical protein